MTETIEVNLIKNKKLSETKNITWPQKYEDFIKDIKKNFQLNQNSEIFLTLITKDDDDIIINTQDDLDPYLEDDMIKCFNAEYDEIIEPPLNPGPGPGPKIDILEIDIDEIIKEVFDNDTYKKELEINNQKLSDNFKSNLELSFNNIMEEKQKVIKNDINSKLKIFVDDFSQKQNENKDLVSEIKNDFDIIKDEVEHMNSGMIEFQKIFKPKPNNPKRNEIIEENPIKLVKFEQKNIEKIIEKKDAKFITINDIKIKNIGNTSIHRLYFVKNQEKSSNDFCFFGNSKEINEYELTMPDKLEPNKSLNNGISMNIKNPKPGQEYKAIINAKENDEIISEPLEIIIKIKEEEDPMKQKMVQANNIYEEIKNQFPNHNNLINKDDIINKLIKNNLNKNEIINDINNKIREIEQKENEAKAEQIYNELNLNNINIDKNEVIENIKNKNFDKEEVQRWIDEKAQIQNKEKAQNLYNNIRNEQNLDFSKCPNEEAILNKIIELKFNENEIRNFFKKKDNGPFEKLVQEIFDQLEEEYNITGFMEEEAIKDKIREIVNNNNGDEEKIKQEAQDWVGDVLVNGVN